MIEILSAEPTLWDKIRMIAEYYSKDSQSKKLLEEMVELAVEINFGLFENGGNLPDNETKERVFSRLKKFGGVKWYRYLDMRNPVIRWVNENLEGME